MRIKRDIDRLPQFDELVKVAWAYCRLVLQQSPLQMTGAEIHQQIEEAPPVFFQLL